MRSNLQRAFWELDDSGKRDPIFDQFKPSDYAPLTFWIGISERPAVVIPCRSCGPQGHFDLDYRCIDVTWTQVHLSRQRFVFPAQFKKRDGTEVELVRFQDAFLGQCERCAQLWIGLLEDPTAG